MIIEEFAFDFFSCVEKFASIPKSNLDLERWNSGSFFISTYILVLTFKLLIPPYRSEFLSSILTL